MQIVSKTQHGSDIGDVENKIPDISGLTTTATFTMKPAEIENIIPDTSKFNNTQDLNRLTKENNTRMTKASNSLATK